MLVYVKSDGLANFSVSFYHFYLIFCEKWTHPGPALTNYLKPPWFNGVIQWLKETYTSFYTAFKAGFAKKKLQIRSGKNNEVV